MFEALLQKILKRIFGKFLDGLDSSNLHLGIWSGRLVIENVSLRKELFEMAGLPYEILFSCIQKMTVQVPWKSISSNPVVIELDSMLVLVVAKPRQQWEKKGLKDVERLVADLNSFIGGYLNRLIENEKTTAANTTDKKGYLDNVYIRVLDNLQFSVRNIHVRYEDNLNRGYSFGLTLQSIQVCTTNEQGKRSFFDRTSTENSKLALLKTVELKNLGLYWKETQTVFLHDRNDQKEMVEFLEKEIYKGGAAQASPNYLLMINSRSLLKQRSNKDLSGPQYQLNFNLGDMRVKLSKTVVQQLISFMEFKSEYSQRSVVGGRPEQASRFKQLFKKYYVRYQTESSDLSKAQRQQFEQLLLSLKQQQVKSIAESEIKLQYRNRIITQMRSRKGNMLLEEADMKEIEQYMENIARPNNEEAPLPPKYVYLSCGVTFNSLSLFIVDDAQRTIFSLSLQRIRTVVLISQQEQKYTFEINDIKSQGKDFKDILWKEKNTEFLKAEYIQQLQGKESLFVRVSPVSLVYDMRTIDQLREFTQVTVKTNLRNRAIDKVEELGVQVGKNIQRKTAVELDVVIDTPTVILLESRKRWVLELGQFTLNKKDGPALIRVANMKASCLTDSNIFECVPSFCVKVAFDSEQMRAHAEVEELKVKLDRVHYLSLISLLTVIRKHTNKSEIMERSSRKALVFLKEKNWKKVMATIAEGYLYFWEKKEYPLAMVRIRKVLIGTDANRSNSIVIGDLRGNNFLVAFEDAGVMNTWLTDLQKIASVQFQEEQEVNKSGTDDKPFEVRLVIGSVQLVLVSTDSQDWLKVEVDAISAKHWQSSLTTKTQASIANISINSGDFKFLSRSASSSDLFSCELISMSEQHPDSQKEGSLNRLRLNSIELNYDPVLVIRMFSFFQQEQDYAPPEQMFDEQTMQKMSQERLLSSTSIEIEGVSVLLINKKTNQPLARMALDRMAAKLSSYYYESVIEGSIGDMSITDLTNYPNTVYEESNNKAGIIPRMVWGSAGVQRSSEILWFRMTSLQDGSKKLKDSQYETLIVRITKAKLVYMHEPVMRIIDYLQVQLKGVLTNPEIFDEYHQETDRRRRPTDYREFIRKKEETISNRMLQAIGKQRIKKLLSSPRELYLNVIIEQPELTILSVHGAGILFTLSCINISNEFFYSDERVITGSVKSVLCERYKIVFEEVTLQLLQNSKPISDQPFNINLSLDMFFKEAEYRFITDQPLQLDTSATVKMFVAPLYFTLSQAGALEIARVAKLNILHEDGLDFLMVHDYIPAEPSGLTIQLDFENINLTLLHEEQSMVEFDIEFLRYAFRKQLNQESQTEINVASIQAKFFVDGEYRQIISRRRNLKMSTSRRNLSISAYHSSCIFEIPKKELPPYVCLSFKATQSKTETATRISLTDNVMVFQTDFILFLKQWVKLPAIQSPAKVYLKEKFRQKLPSLTDLRTIQNSRSIVLTRNLISCVVPNSEKMLNCSFSAIYTNNSSNEKIISVEDMELFFCKISDISNEQFSSIKRRTFVGNFGMQCRINESLTETSVLLSLSRIIMKFSLKDIKMLVMLANILQDKIAKLATEGKPEELPEPLSQPKPKLKVGIKSRSFEILLINDTANRYFPILYFNIETLKDLEVTKADSLVLETEIRLFARYFNLKISVWEPVLESTQLRVSYQQFLTDKPRTSLVVSPLVAEEYTTVDVSTNFVQTLLKTINDMELEFRSFEQSDWLSDSMNACVVVNNTGYPIECTCSGQRFFIENDSRHELKIRQLEAEQQMLIETTTTDIYLEVEIPLSRTHLRHINLKSEDVTRIVVTTRKKPTYLVKVVRVDISKNIRYVSLVSPVLLVNSTGVDLFIKIGETAPEIYFPNGAVKSVPFDDVEETVRIIYEAETSEPIRIFENVKRIKLGNYAFNVSEVMKEESRRITLDSPYKLTSLLPHALYLNFRTSTQKFYSLFFPPFDPKQVVTHTFFEQIQRTEVSWFVDADNMLWTAYQTFAEGPKIMEDMFSGSFTVNIQRIEKPEQNSINFVIFPTVVMLNKSDEKLAFYYSNKTLIPGQKLHTENRSVISSALQTVIIRSEGTDLYCPPIKLSKEPKELILRLEKSIDGEPVKVNCVMLLQHHPISLYDIRFDKYTLSCQYRLVNSTAVELLVRHANALMTETTKLPAGGSQNLYWFSEDYEKQIRITPNASNWQWSAPLNIQRPELTHFILRDRSNYRKLLFMTLQVKLVQQQRNIQMKVLTDINDYPFLLINESDQVNIVIPALKMTLGAASQTYFSWDDPAKQLYQVEVALQPSRPDNTFKERVVFLKQKRVENEVLEIKAAKGLLKLQIDVVTRFNQKIFRFRNYIPQAALDTATDSHYRLEMPLAICLINNTGGRGTNLLSAYTNLRAQFIVGEGQQHKQLTVNCSDVQVDNNTKLYVYFPVVLKTSFHLTLTGKKDVWLELQLQMDKIILRLEEGFVYQLYSVLLLLQSFLPQQSNQQSSFSISRVKLPKLDIQLQVQAKKLSIETPIELERPAQTSYPWDTFPYPIKDIVLSLLSNLSISPISFISSLHEGVVNLFNQSSSGRGVQSFLTRIIGSIGSGINGMVRILVGDMERIDTFVDGVESGTVTCLRTTLSSLTTFYYEPTPLGLLKTAAGLIYKPITGLLQLTLKISEGIKNTTKFSFQVEDFETRKRYPMVFYGSQHYYKQYDSAAAELMQLLQQFQNGRFKDISLANVVYVKQPGQELSVIVVSATHLIHLTLQSKKCMWTVPLGFIKQVKLREQFNAIQLILSDDVDGLPNRNPIIVVGDNRLARSLYESLEQSTPNLRLTS